MKIVRFIVYSLFIVPVLLSSCTKLTTPYAASKHGNIKDTIVDWDTVTPVRKVLLEDYTGHYCTNCPDAAITARTLAASNKGKLVVMAVHAGYYARKGTGDYALDLESAEGTQWNNDFNITSNPNGMINRKIFNDNRVVSADKWGESVTSLISLAPDAMMKIFPVLDTTTRQLQTLIYSHFINKLPDAYKITVCVLEDSIIGSQKNNNPNIGPTPDWPNYVFNGVMRGTMNGAEGEILTTAIDLDLTYMGKFAYTLNTVWNFRNCYVMAYIYDATTLEIVQVERVKIYN
jgi:hypothetical protein